MSTGYPESMRIGVTAMGAISPVGAGVDQTCASIRARISRFSEHPFFEGTPPDPEWDPDLPVTVAAVPDVDLPEDGPDRLHHLLLPAFTELCGKIGLRRTDLGKGGIFLGLPHPDPVIREWDFERRFLPGFREGAGIDPFRVERVSQGGRAAGIVLIDEAVRRIASGEIEFALVGGVDSYLMPERMAHLDGAWRIRTERNVDGFIPGEAAVLLFLEPDHRAGRRDVPLLSVIDAAGFGTEPESLLLSDKASTGKGIVDAVRGITADKPEGHLFDWVCSDLNGESYGAYEWGLLQTRLAKQFDGRRKLVHPADCLGDVGAATGALLVACATHAFQWGYNPSGEALLLASSDDGARAAMTVRHPGA